MKRSYIAAGALALMLATGAIVSWLATREPAPLEFTDLKGINVISPAIPLPPVTLQDQDGHPLKTGNFRGKWSLVFFGYTRCPDVCPTTLATLKRVYKKLKENKLAGDTAVVFVSLDPKRDTQQALKDYITYFDPDFIGARGDKQEIDRLAEKLGIVYEYEGDTSGDNYIVNHYSAILVIDPQARLRAHILAPHSVDKVYDAFNRIRDYYGS